MSLVIILLNWNNASDTILCVQAIQAWQSLKPQIWVVDNCSHDDSVAQLRQCCRNIRLLLSERNLGFAIGNNRAIRQAMDADATCFLLLNNDATISEDDVRQLVTTLETDPHAGIVGPLLRDPLPAAGLQAAGGRNVAWHVATHRLDLPQSADPFPVDYVPGTAILISDEVFRTVGLLDDRYFFSGEIADFCLRARRAGFACLIDPQTTAYHDTGRSSDRREALYAYYSLRNRFLYVRKFYSLAAVPLMFYWGSFGLASVAGAILRRRRTRARALWLALRHGLSGTFGDQSELILAGAQKP
jgi:GT2 family glycosyltransferase